MQRLNARIRIQLGMFVALALVGTSYIGASYVGIDLFRSGYPVTVTLPDSGGVFVNGEVTYRGVPVGEITELTATEEGVEATLEINADAPPIPADVTVRVANRSAIGEQYIDLRGTSTEGGELEPGARLTAGREALPQDISELLTAGRDFTGSVPADSLRTVIDEGYDLSQGAGDDLRRLVDTSMDFQRAADRNFLVSASLIRSSATVLETQEESADSIRAYSSDLSVLADTLRDSDGDLRRLIASAPAATREISALMDQVGTPLGVLMGNLVSTAQVFGVNAAGVEDALIRVPEAVSIGYAVTDSRGINLGLTTTFFDPLPCDKGYGGTETRPGTDTSPGEPFNTDAGCTAPPSGSGVRGPGSLPSPKVKRPSDVRVPSTMADLMGAPR